jgi:hypothetical protein
MCKIFTDFDNECKSNSIFCLCIGHQADSDNGKIPDAVPGGKFILVNFGKRDPNMTVFDPRHYNRSK